MRYSIFICLVVAFGLVGTGCVNSRPIHYYMIETPSAPKAPSADGPVLVVTTVSVPVALQDGRIRYRTGSNEAGAYEFHRWMERPGTMVTTSLVHALRASGKYRRVVEASSSAAGDYVLRGKLYEFDEVDRDRIQTRISLQIELVDMKTKRDVWDHLVEREEPVTSKNVSEVVQSLERNLAHVANEAAVEIDKFLSANH